MMHSMAGGCGQLGGVFMAATAALGYWVLRQAEKDSAAVRWGGRVVGWVLVVGGLAGFICASVSHALSHGSCARATAQCGHRMSMDGGLPSGHPPIGDLDGDAGPSQAPPAGKKAK